MRNKIIQFNVIGRRKLDFKVLRIVFQFVFDKINKFFFFFSTCTLLVLSLSPYR